MLARRKIPLNLTILENQNIQSYIENFRTWIQTGDDEYSDKLELYNSYKRGVDITNYIPFFMMSDNDFNNLYNNMKNSNNWTFEYSIMKGDKKDHPIDDLNIIYSFIYPIDEKNFGFVYFADSNKDKDTIGIEIVKNCISTTCTMKHIMSSQAKDISNIIMILSKPLTPAAKKSILEVDKGCPYTIQIFNENEISNDPFDCIYNSGIEIITKNKEDTNKWARDHNLMISQIPRRPIEDIQLKYLGCEAGLIIKLTRKCLIPENIFKKEITYAYTYYKPEEKPRTVKKKVISDVVV
jgi:hypothetical protein